jgi:hypothetical protein
MNHIQQIVLDKLKTLSIPQQESVLKFIEKLLSPHIVESDQQLEELLIEGVESIDRGEGIEATDEWWDRERDRLASSSESLTSAKPN